MAPPRRGPGRLATAVVLLGACVLSACVLSACGLFGDHAAPLDVLWVADGGSDAVIGSLGGADERHVYSIGRVGGARMLRALRREDGSVAWERPVGPSCSPILSDGERVLCPSHHLYAYDARTGRTLWTFEPAAPLYFAEGAVGGGRVFSASYRYAEPSASRLYAHDAATGQLLWERGFEGPRWDHVRIRAITLDGDELIVAMDAHYERYATYGTAVLIGVDAATGAERWRYENGDGAEPHPCEASGATVYRGPGAPPAGLILYVNHAGNGCPEGHFVALDRATRALAYQIAAAPNWGGSGQAPIVRDGVAFATWNDGSTYAFEAATGRIRWQAQPPGSGSPYAHAVCGEVVVASNRSTDVFDRRTGRLLGTLHDDDYDEFAAELSVVDDRLYIGTNRAVFAYDCR